MLIPTVPLNTATSAVATPATASSQQMFFLQGLMKKCKIIPEGVKNPYGWFVPDWTSPAPGVSASAHAGELLTLHGVGKAQVAEALAYLTTAKPVDKAVFWRTLRLNPPTQAARDAAFGRQETVVRRRKVTPALEAEKVAAVTAPPAELFNPAIPAWPSRKR